MKKYYPSLRAYLLDGGRESDLYRAYVAGPNASAAGMRKHFWGEKAIIVKRGRYLYCVGWLR